MSMYLEFEPHSWYYGFAIKKDENYNDPCETETDGDEKFCRVHGKEMGYFQTYCDGYAPKWSAFTEDGNSYSIVELHAASLTELKREIVRYWFRDKAVHMPFYYMKKLAKSKERLDV